MGAKAKTKVTKRAPLHQESSPGRSDFLKITFKGPIATPEELKAYWTMIIAESRCYDKDRLKASELLGKSLAMFTENVNTKHDFGEEINAIIRALSREQNGSNA